jgi:hypothetical protein
MIERPHVEFVDPAAIAPEPLRAPFSAAELMGRALVGDLSSGNGAALVELPAGWRGLARTTAAFELIVIDGEIEADGTAVGRHGYLSATTARMPQLSSKEGARVFVDAIADIEEARVVPMGDDGWGPTPLEGLTLRATRASLDRACGFFLRVPAGWSMPLTEWHECAEAALMLEGDLWHVRANGGSGGTMRELCYFWRSPYLLHSPMGSDTGALMWIYVDGPLVNHFVEIEGGPPQGG